MTLAELMIYRFMNACKAKCCIPRENSDKASPALPCQILAEQTMIPRDRTRMMIIRAAVHRKVAIYD